MAAWRPGDPHTAETRARVSAWQKGRVRTPEQIAKLAAALTKRPCEDGKWLCARCREYVAPEHMNKTRTYCRPCARAINREFYYRNHERELQRSRAAAPKRREYARDYMRSWREKNRERYIATRAAWQESNRERVRLYDHNKRVRRAAEKSGAVITPLEWAKARWLALGRCFYCGRPDGPLTMDHFMPLALGGAHAINNIIPSCRQCNSRKQAMHPLNWLHRLEIEMKKGTPLNVKEKHIKAQILLSFGSRNDVMIWNNPVGVATPIGTNRIVKFGTKGAPDILGVQRRTVERRTVINPGGFQPVERLTPFMYGQAIAIETKTRTGRQREAQKNWESAWIEMGGIYILARSVEDVLAVLGPDSAD